MMGNIAPYNAPTLTLPLKGEGKSPTGTQRRGQRRGHNEFIVSPWFCSHCSYYSPPEGESKCPFSISVGGDGKKEIPPRICKRKSRSPSRGEQNLSP